MLPVASFTQLTAYRQTACRIHRHGGQRRFPDPGGDGLIEPESSAIRALLRSTPSFLPIPGEARPAQGVALRFPPGAGFRQLRFREVVYAAVEIAARTPDGAGVGAVIAGCRQFGSRRLRWTSFCQPK
jgi:hypothetical protein